MLLLAVQKRELLQSNIQREVIYSQEPISIVLLTNSVPADRHVGHERPRIRGRVVTLHTAEPSLFKANYLYRPKSQYLFICSFFRHHEIYTIEQEIIMIIGYASKNMTLRILTVKKHLKISLTLINNSF